jgi:hypothetical protein
MREGRVELHGARPGWRINGSNDRSDTWHGTRPSVLDPEASRDDEGESRRRLACGEVFPRQHLTAARIMRSQRKDRKQRRADQVEAEVPLWRIRCSFRAAAICAAGSVSIVWHFAGLFWLLMLYAAICRTAVRRCRGHAAEAVRKDALLAAAQRHPRRQGKN